MIPRKAIPIRSSERKQLSIPRVPHDGPLTPRLQRRGPIEAIGFRMPNIMTEAEADEYFKRMK